MNKKRNFIICIVLDFLFIIFTILVKTIDVKQIGPQYSFIGFATINQIIFKTTGTNIIWYYITDWLGILPVIIAISYALIGIFQLIKRKSLFKVDKEIICLGFFYIVLIGLYVFFENVIINYRPILINGVLEASYPSSHTIMAIFLCGSSIIVNKKLYKNRFTKTINVFSLAIIIITIVGRLISGVHWFTDILGGMLLSSALITTFYFTIQNIQKDNS